jgi:hypothetical protein
MMNSSLWRILRLLTVLGFGATQAPASVVALPPDPPNLSGVYEDAGTIVSVPDGQEPLAVVSLHALLSLEFNPGLARLLHERTREVRVQHEGTTLAVEFIDADGEKIWAPVWTRESGLTLRDQRLMLRLKPGKFGDDEYVLVFENITTHRLLQVHLQRLKPTFLGPVFQPMGTFLFHRLD